MNREIKFRGKRLDNGEWVYGDLLRTPDGFAILKSDECAPVDPATIDQFTGFYDRVGKEIYEGDIVNWIRVAYGEGFVEEGRVEWAQEEGGWIVINKFETKDNRKIVQRLIRCMNKIKVVGNVCGNPELKKGGEK